ncbi:MAG: polymorphic toxin type 50 domain-containing protein [Ruminococcus sp.]|nr:polymorphic toxin type 50 domain-containing protein [Ruminococcus sp.]
MNESYFTVPIEELQKLIDKYYGTGKVYVKKDGEILEYINITEIRGYVVTKEGEYLGETNRFKVHYSKKRTHIVPTKEENS